MFDVQYNHPRARTRTHTILNTHILQAVSVSTPEAEKKLREAAEKGETAEVQRLLSQGADPNGCDSVCVCVCVCYVVCIYVYISVLARGECR